MSVLKKYGPEHEICKTNTGVPTITVAEMPYVTVEDGYPRSEPKRKLFVQWFGQSMHALPEDVEIPEGSQFLFSVLADPDDAQFYLHPETFRVVWLDQIKNWPNRQALQAMIDGPGEGNADKWMVWLLSSYVQIEYSFGRKGPVSPILEIALLGDPNCGIITPQRYLNMAVRDEELARCQ